jgi:hypothetical protein
LAAGGCRQTCSEFGFGPGVRRLEHSVGSRRNSRQRQTAAHPERGMAWQKHLQQQQCLLLVRGLRICRRPWPWLTNNMMIHALDRSSQARDASCESLDPCTPHQPTKPHTGQAMQAGTASQSACAGGGGLGGRAGVAYRCGWCSGRPSPSLSASFTRLRGSGHMHRAHTSACDQGWALRRCNGRHHSLLQRLCDPHARGLHVQGCSGRTDQHANGVCRQA